VCGFSSSITTGDGCDERYADEPANLPVTLQRSYGLSHRDAGQTVQPAHELTLTDNQRHDDEPDTSDLGGRRLSCSAKVSRACSSGKGFDVVGQCGEPRELIELTREHRPELAIVDIRMPPSHTTEGLDAARVIREEVPETAIVVLSGARRGRARDGPARQRGSAWAIC